MKRGHYEKALEHIGQSLDRNRNNSRAWVVKAAAYRKLLLFDSALQTVNEALKLDRFNLGALFEKASISKLNSQDDKAKRLTNELLMLSRRDERNLLEYALDYAAAGLYEEAGQLLAYAVKETDTNPMVFYTLGWFSYKAGNHQKAKEWFNKATIANPYLCFPNRLIEINILQAAIKMSPADAKAPYYLGNLFYDKRQYADAIKCWEVSVQQDNAFSTVHRNLGIAYFNKQNDPQKALNSYEKAFSLDPTDARVLMELDQLYKRLNRAPAQRLKFLEDHLAVTEQRDDTYLERLSLYNFAGDYETALDLIETRKFHPWEGGEGKVSYQYLLSLVQLAKHFIQQNQYEKAIEYLEKAQTYPHNLGEGKLYGAQENDIDYWMGCAYAGLDKHETANEYFTKATRGLSEPH